MDVVALCYCINCIAIKAECNFPVENIYKPKVLCRNE